MLEKTWDLLSDYLKVGLRRAESSLYALKTVDLGPKRPFSVGECALWTQLTAPQFAAQAAEPSRGSCKSSLGYCFTQGGHGHQIFQQGEPFDQKFIESPFAGKHPKPIQKGTKAAAAEANENRLSA